MSRLELSMAWRYMRSRRGSRLLSLISVIAVGGVTVGVSALIVIIGVMNGMQRDLRDKILVASPDIRVLPYGGDLVMPNWRSVMEKVRRDPGVTAVAPFVHTQALLSPGTKYVTAVFVMGIVPAGDSAPPVTSIRTTATGGTFSFKTPDGRRNGVLVGQRLAQTLGITPGITTVLLVTADPLKTDPITGIPSTHSESFLVTGLFNTGMYEYDNSYVFLSLEAAQRLAQLDTAVTGLEVRTPSREEAPAIAFRLQDSLGLGVRTDDWQSQNSALFQALKLEKKGMTFILLLIILVAAFNIVGTLSMVVADKTREIGILRAMGMRAGSVRRVFFAQGMIIGGAGTLAGTVLGLVASFLIDHYKLIKIQADVYFIDHLPVATQAQDVVSIILASMAIAALATLYPARQAASLYPVEAIRHE
jgi:lipoprotein-releasing system permease protein